MKKAFTMLELIIVIAVVGILAAVVIPRSGSNKLAEAALQVVSHIRYTQHLAMIDDKFDSNDANWFVERWTIDFGTTAENNGWIYDISSDQNDNGTNTDLVDIARNTLDPSKVMSGWLVYGSDLYSKEMDLTNQYGIQNVTFSNNCQSGAVEWELLSFDYQGRPYRGNPHTMTSAYSAPTQRLITAQCTITLTDGNGDNVVIAIEPETGYAHIL